MTALINIDGKPIPDPSTYEAHTATIVDSARNTEGVMVGAVVRNDVAKVSMSWKFISAKDWANILKLFRPAAGGKFINYVTFFLQDDNGWTTRQMYVSDRKANIFLRNPDGTIKGYTDAQFSLIEV